MFDLSEGIDFLLSELGLQKINPADRMMLLNEVHQVMQQESILVERAAEALLSKPEIQSALTRVVTSPGNGLTHPKVARAFFNLVRFPGFRREQALAALNQRLYASLA